MGIMCNTINTRFHHPNLITLMGYSFEQKCLVYPYMARMSLFKNLHSLKAIQASNANNLRLKINIMITTCMYNHSLQDAGPLNMYQRTAILKGAACGITYLHDDQPPCVHHDINS